MSSPILRFSLTPDHLDGLLGYFYQQNDPQNLRPSPFNKGTVLLYLAKKTESVCLMFLRVPQDKKSKQIWNENIETISCYVLSLIKKCNKRGLVTDSNIYFLRKATCLEPIKTSLSSCKIHGQILDHLNLAYSQAQGQSLPLKDFPSFHSSKKTSDHPQPHSEDLTDTINDDDKKNTYKSLPKNLRFFHRLLCCLKKLFAFKG